MKRRLNSIRPYWEQIMPAMPDELMQKYLRTVADALAAGGGAAYPFR